MHTYLEGILRLRFFRYIVVTLCIKLELYLYSRRNNKNIATYFMVCIQLFAIILSMPLYLHMNTIL